MSNRCCDVLFSSELHFFGAMLSSLVDRYRVPQPRLVARGCFVARAYEALRSWVVKEVNKVISLSNDIDSTVASRFKAERVQRSGQTVECRASFSSDAMEEVFFGSVWNLVGFLVTTDDVVMLRTVARCWTMGNRLGALGNTFLMTKMEHFENRIAIRMANACTQ